MPHDGVALAPAGIFREQQLKNTAVRRDWVSKHKEQFMDSFEPPVFHELPLHVRQQTFPKYRGVALTKGGAPASLQWLLRAAACAALASSCARVTRGR